MYRNKAFYISILLSLSVLLLAMIPNVAQGRSATVLQDPQLIGPGVLAQSEDVEGAVHAYYFYTNDCPHCIVVLEEIIRPLQAKHGNLFDIRLLELGDPNYYAALIKVETHFDVKSADRGLPTLVIGNQILIGEEAARENLEPLVDAGLAAGGIDFPAIEGVDQNILISVNPQSDTHGEICTVDEGESCLQDAPIYAAYFYQVGCKECSRVDSDLNYLKSLYPQLNIEEFNIYDEAPLAQWMSERVGREEEFHVPALFINDHAWIGEEEITPQSLEPILQALTTTGAEPIWLSFDTESGLQNLISRFSSMGWLAVVLAGLIDGLNPCAFATLVFFVSYLTLSGRKGKEVLTVGGAFTLGVFLAYLGIGLGLYKLFDLIGDTLTIVGRIVYGFTAVLCLVLAVVSIRDYFKARKGEIGDMALNLPEPLRKRINATIRKGRNISGYVLGSFITGILISFLELACTGQIYLPTIIFVSSIPELRLQAISYLMLYNLLFILPLVVVFIMAYYGTTSKDLAKFLKDRAAAVKLGMAVIFLLLAVWLALSLFT